MSFVQLSGNSRSLCRSNLILWVFLIAGFPLQSAHAQSALSWSAAEESAFEALPVVSVATDSTWPPMEYINREGELVGFDIDLLREIGRRSGFHPVFTTVPWDGIFAGLMAGHYEMIASSVTLLEERKRVMRFSRPYFRAAQFLLVPRENDDARSLSDLAGMDVGAQIGTTGSRLVAATPDVTVRSYDDLGLAVEDLAQGKLGGVVADTAIIQYFVLSHPRYRDILRVAGSPYAVEEYAFAIDMEREELQEAIDRALESIIADGTLKRLLEYWFPDLDRATLMPR